MERRDLRGFRKREPKGFVFRIKKSEVLTGYANFNLEFLLNLLVVPIPLLVVTV